nr:transaldolase [Pseudactinotalea sp. HY160]
MDRLNDAGVAIWLDDLSREALGDGSLADLIATKNVVGVTSNPTIFQKSVGDGTAYAEQLADLAGRGVSVAEAVTTITTDDVRAACDLFLPTYEATGGKDGRVSIEVDPRLAHDTDGSVAQAFELARIVDRPNLMVKIPATVEGLPAITAATAAGISVNVTLIFSLDRYRAVATAFVDGLEQARAAGIDPGTIRSTASIFLSRIDVKVDDRLDRIGSPEALAARGTIAVANARLAYEVYEEIFSAPRFADLAAAGAHAQRPLWASTGTKNPEYSDTKYVDELVTDDVVNTMPHATLEAVLDHSRAGADTVRGHYDEARAAMATVTELGIDLDAVMAELEAEGVEKFEKSWQSLIDTVSAEMGR